MIRELSDDTKLINELENSFSYVISDINSDLLNNPFSHYLVYIENDKILGFINYYLMYDRIEIANFNVLEDYQNKNIGNRLLNRLITDFLGKVDNITLEVKKDNSKAIYLYKKYGFIEKAIRKEYYNGIDGILMERKMDK